MTFNVYVADKATGKEHSLVFECFSAEEAFERASAQGFMVASVELVDEGWPSRKPLAEDAGDAGRKVLDAEADLAQVVAVVAALLLTVGGLIIAKRCWDVPCVGLLGVAFGATLTIAGVGLGVGLLKGRTSKPPVVRSDRIPIMPRTMSSSANAAMICPHCQSRGTVTTERVKMKKGVSGAKATGAVLTSGLSILVTGLSRKELLTRAHCTNCGNTWHF